MTQIIVEPYVEYHAIDERGVVHRAVSYKGNTNVCKAYCGLIRRWSHDNHVDTLVLTDQTPSCMSCLVRGFPRAIE